MTIIDGDSRAEKPGDINLKKVAEALLDLHKREVHKVEIDFISGNYEDANAPSEWFSIILNDIADSDLERFEAHGIIKGTRAEQLYALLSMLTEGKIIGSWARMSNSSYVDAYTEGSFTVISRIDEPLCNRNNVLNIGVIVVNPLFEALIPDLTRLNPYFTFLKAEDFPRWLAEQKKITIGVFAARLKRKLQEIFPL